MIAEVIVNISNNNVDQVFDYIISDDMKITPGMRVLVPFRKSSIMGFVLKIKKTTSVESHKLKYIIKSIDNKPVIKEEMIKLLGFMIKHYNLRNIDVLKLFTPFEVRKNIVKPLIKEVINFSKTKSYKDITSGLRANAKLQKRLLDEVYKNKDLERVYLNKKYTSKNVNKFINEGVFSVIQKPVRIVANPNINFERIVPEYTLNTEQKGVIQKLNSSLNSTSKVLVHGVTGSGKTEVYLNIIDTVFSKGKSAILLVPEISLTPQMLNLFRSRFGENVAVLHSGLTGKERLSEWTRIYHGEAKIVLGARSAIFSPVENLGVIIMDEEHDQSYISESNPRYDTHEIAEFRSEQNNCPLVLGSATPSVESFYNTQKGKYELVEMKKRINNKKMPTIEIADMKNELLLGNTSFISNKLDAEIKNAINNEEQIMLFINRRGYSSFLRCTKCGHVPKCTDCDVSLVYHKNDGQLKCHFCDKRFKQLKSCPECSSEKIRQAGVGTQKVVEELNQRYPEIPVFRMDNDTTKVRNAHFNILKEFASKKPSILVGTQMIAKGHDFENVSLVGVLDADLSLYFSDYKAVERTYQLLTQVSGRAGREKHRGKVVVQTYTPGHYIYRFIKNYDYHGFYEKEKRLRHMTSFPPYTKILRILLTSEDDSSAKQSTVKYLEKIKLLQDQYKDQFLYLEAMRPPIKKIKGKYRYQILARFYNEKADEIIDNIYNIDNNIKLNKTYVFIEINPQSLR